MTAMPELVRRYLPTDAPSWDRLVRESENGTVLHTRRYLDYHAERFLDESRVVVDDRGELVAVFPAARGRSPDEVVSHPGLTFGGLVYGARSRGTQIEAMLAEVLESLAEDGYRRLDYRAVPGVLRARLGDDDIYALFRLGADAYSRGLSSVVDLRRAKPSKSRLGCIKKARRLGVELSDDVAMLPAYWALLETQLKARHQAAPVHTLQEMEGLATRLPQDIRLRVALMSGAVVAGAVLYRYRADVLHTQYLCTDDTGRTSSALDLVIASLTADRDAEELSFLSFGISNDPSNGALNDDLFQYKHSFGATGHSLLGFHVDCRVS